MTTGPSSREEYAQTLKQAYRAVFIGILVFAATVAYIFWSSSYAWEQKQKRYELEAKQRAAERIAQLSDVGVYAWVNQWELVARDNEILEGPEEYREAQKLAVGTEYRVGTLRQLDRSNNTGWNQVRPNADDSLYFSDPILTLAYNGFIHASYSIDHADGWLTYGPTSTGLKTGTYQYIPETEASTDQRDAWGEGRMSVRLPANGTNNLTIPITDQRISDAMRGYNTVVDQSLSEVYDGVPAEFAKRTRLVWTSHLIVEVYKKDPRLKGADRTPTLTFKIRIRNYGAWDLTKEEYAGLIFAVPALTERDYAPRMTVEVLS